MACLLRLERLLGAQTTVSLFNPLQRVCDVHVRYFAAEAQSSSSRWVPSWMQSLMPGGDKLAVNQPKKPKEAAGTSTSSKDEERKRLKELEANKDMTMQGYVEHCRNIRLQNDPPQPQFSPVKPDHYDFLKFTDTQRIAWLRIFQHEKIGSVFTPADSIELNNRGKDIAEDKVYLNMIAERTGTYIDLEVKDLLVQYFKTKDQFRHLYKWCKEGNPYPRSQQEQTAVFSEMEAREEAEKHQEKLKKRDRRNCPVMPKLKWVGPECECQLTGLPFFKCCGEKVRAFQRKPPQYQGGMGKNKGKPRRKTLPRHWQKYMHIVEAHNSVQYKFDDWWHDKTEHVRLPPTRSWDR